MDKQELPDNQVLDLRLHYKRSGPSSPGFQKGVIARQLLPSEKAGAWQGVVSMEEELVNLTVFQDLKAREKPS